MSTKSLVLLAVIASGCATAVPTYEMHVNLPPREALNTLASALAAEGLACAALDEQRGVLATTWRDSGYRVVVSPQGAEYEDLAAIFRRYEVLVSAGPGGSTVRLLVDARRCAEPFQEADVAGTCGDATYDGSVLRHDLAALARRLGERTGTSVAIAPAKAATH